MNDTNIVDKCKAWSKSYKKFDCDIRKLWYTNRYTNSVFIQHRGKWMVTWGVVLLTGPTRTTYCQRVTGSRIWYTPTPTSVSSVCRWKWCGSGLLLIFKNLVHFSQWFHSYMVFGNILPFSLTHSLMSATGVEHLWHQLSFSRSPVYHCCLQVFRIYAYIFIQAVIFKCEINSELKQLFLDIFAYCKAFCFVLLGSIWHL